MARRTAAVLDPIAEALAARRAEELATARARDAERRASATPSPAAVRLKAARLSAGLTCEQLGQAVGSNKQFISMVERGTRPATLEFLAECAFALGVVPATLHPLLTRDRKRPA